MASVRMSQKIRDEIKYNSEKLFTKSLNKAQSKLAEDFADRAMDDIYATYYEPYSEYIKKIPGDWLQEANGIDITIMGKVAGEEKRYVIRKESTVKTYLIPRQDRQTVNYNNSYYKDGHKLSEPLWNELHEYNARIEKIEKEKDMFIEELTNVLGRCNTLKQFIDIWPHAEELIDSEYLDKLKEPVERTRQRLEVDPEVSTQINSILVKRSIMNSRD